MCMIDDAEDFAVIWEETERKARKTHKCTECRREINKGERYLTIASLCDSKWWNYRHCQHCQASTAWLNKECGGYLPEFVFQEIEDHWRENPNHRSIGLARILIGMRRRWKGFKSPLMKVPQIKTIQEGMQP